MIALLLIATIATSSAAPATITSSSALTIDTSSAAQWKSVALEFRESSFRWSSIADRRQVRLDEMSLMLTDRSAENARLNDALAAKPAPVEVTPAWMPWAIAGAAIAGATLALGVFELAHARGPP